MSFEVFAERGVGILIVLFSLVSDGLFLVATVYGIRLARERRRGGRHSSGTLGFHRRAVFAAVAVMAVMIVMILTAIPVFSIPLTPFYFRVHRPLVRALTVFLIGALMLNGKRAPRAHLLFAPFVWALYTAAAITGDILVIPLFLGR